MNEGIFFYTVMLSGSFALPPNSLNIRDFIMKKYCFYITTFYKQLFKHKLYIVYPPPADGII